AAAVFFLVAAFVWLPGRFGRFSAGGGFGGAVALVALIALPPCPVAPPRHMPRAPPRPAGRRRHPLPDPQHGGVAGPMRQARGARGLAALAALAVRGGAAAKEWSAHATPAEDDAAEDDADSGSED